LFTPLPLRTLEEPPPPLFLLGTVSLNAPRPPQIVAPPLENPKSKNWRELLLFLPTTAELADLEQRDDRPGIEEPEQEQEQEHEENEDNKLLVDNIAVTAFVVVVVVVAAMVLIAAAATATIFTILPHKQNTKIATTKSSLSTATELQRESRNRQAQQQTLSQEQKWLSSFGEDDPTEKLFSGLDPGSEKISCG
jgi:hypothetical protein